MIIQIEDTGSNYGSTAFLEIAYGCLRKAWYDKVARDQRQSDTESIYSGSRGMLTGTVFHALLAAYYSGKNPLDDSTEFEGPLTDAEYFPEAAAKAVSTYVQYREICKYDEFGPRDALQIEKSFGSEDFLIARPDIVAKINTKTAKQLANAWDLPIKKGTYIIDHKTTSAMSNGLLDYWRYSLQFSLYADVLEREGTIIDGSIINAVSTTKTPQIKRMFVPSLRDDSLQKARLDWVKDVFYAKGGWSIYDLPLGVSLQPNVSKCITFTGRCPHWASGVCRGY